MDTRPPPAKTNISPENQWLDQIIHFLMNRSLFLGGILDTVDERNPAPVDVVDILVFIVFYISQVVVWDF